MVASEAFELSVRANAVHQQYFSRLSWKGINIDRKVEVKYAYTISILYLCQQQFFSKGTQQVESDIIEM